MNSLLPYLTFIAARIGLAAMTVFGVAALVFFGMKAIPGNYVDLFYPMTSPEERALLEVELGLDRPVIVQFGIWLGDVVHGDFGISLTSKKPVLSELARRLPLTMELAGLALLVITLVGLPLGIISRMFHQNWSSQIGRHLANFLMSIPNFVLGSILLYLFSVNQLWFKVGGWAPISDGLATNLSYAILPAFTLSITGVGLILATARGSVLGVMGQDHILAAVSRGLKPPAIFSRHILRNSLIPVITVLAIVAGYLLGGTVLVETVFSLDGVGRLLVNAIIQRDYPVVQAGVILTATAFVLVNTLADILYSLIDPRVAEKTDG